MKQFRLLILLTLLSPLLSPMVVQAAITGVGNVGTMNFDCDVFTNVCTCEGVWEGADCKAMRDNNCPTATKNCPEGDCECPLKTSSRTLVKPMLAQPIVPLLVAPAPKQAKPTTILRPAIKVHKPAGLRVAPVLVKRRQPMVDGKNINSKQLQPGIKMVAPASAPVHKNSLRMIKSTIPNKMDRMLAPTLVPGTQAISVKDCVFFGGTVQQDVSCSTKMSCIINKSNGCVTKAAVPE